jgi:hypothetical protein
MAMPFLRHSYVMAPPPPPAAVVLAMAEKFVAPLHNVWAVVFIAPAVKLAYTVFITLADVV